MTTDVKEETLCARCTEIDWEDAVSQVGILSSIRYEICRQTDRGSPKLDLSPFDSSCPVCRLFSALVEIEHRKGHMAKYFKLKGEEYKHYMDADTLRPILCGPLNGFPVAGGFHSRSTLGLATKGYEGVIDDSSRKLRKIDPAKIDINLLQNWISTCDSQHEGDCNFHNPESIPSLRVIDVHTGFLEEARPGCKFIALSYVWGSSPPPANESYNDQGHNLLETAPDTIKDAAQLTRELGHQYIWVDRYCIPQDDSQAKHDQIQRMDLVYRQSELTIIDAAGEDAEFGLPGIKRRARDAQPSAQVGKHLYLVATDAKYDSYFDSTWRTRGWTYQEAIFSRKCVVFTRREMYFQCRSMTCRETVCRPGTPALFTSSLGGSVRAAWGHITAYSSRKLSFDSDALNGMLGIFRQYRMSQNPVFNFWGIPFSGDTRESAEQSFLLGICWSFTIHAEGRRRHDFPSWSWTGWETCAAPYPTRDGEPPKLTGSVSLHFNDGSVLGFHRVFDHYIKEPELRGLSRFLTIECWTFELEVVSPIETWCDSRDYRSHRLVGSWVWPVERPELVDGSRIALYLDQDTTLGHHLPPMNSSGCFLCLVFGGMEEFVPSQRDQLVTLAIVVTKMGDHYERIGHFSIDDSLLFRISASTFEPISKERLKIKNWLPSEFKWRNIKIG
ncbi:heterokaryon incompatibility protein-domain-containing protein [Hypomontagnella submonticulosa]|nr:heterokaryon incompatibility protein-domain-containing protein [Hypomontagnella submonticulosa]